MTEALRQEKKDILAKLAWLNVNSPAREKAMKRLAEIAEEEKEASRSAV